MELIASPWCFSCCQLLSFLDMLLAISPLALDTVGSLPQDPPVPGKLPLFHAFSTLLLAKTLSSSLLPLTAAGLPPPLEHHRHYWVIACFFPCVPL